MKIPSEIDFGTGFIVKRAILYAYHISQKFPISIVNRYEKITNIYISRQNLDTKHSLCFLADYSALKKFQRNL